MTSTHTNGPLHPGPTDPSAAPCVHCGAGEGQRCAAGCFAEIQPERRPDPLAGLSPEVRARAADGLRQHGLDAGPWRHVTDGSLCPVFLSDKPRPNDDDLWWCTEHQSHLIPGGSELVVVGSIAAGAIAARLGQPFPDGVLDVRQDASDDDALIVHVNSGGNAIVVEVALNRAGYDVAPLPAADDVHGVLLRVRASSAAALDSAADPRPIAPSRPDRFAHPLFAEVLAAREKAHEKHGDNSIERVPADSPDWLPILGEEFGEVCGALTYDKDAAMLRSELIDVLAVGTAWVSALDRAQGYDERPAWASTLWADVLAARARREAPTEPTDPRWLRRLGDEIGALCECLLLDGVRRTMARNALVDLLAVAAGWVDAIDRAVISS